MTGRLLVVRAEGPPEAGLALEEALLARAAAGQPALAWWTWPGPVVVLGYAQPVDDVELALARRSGIRVLRRITGGTGVIHRGDLALSLALPARHPWARSVRGLYDGFLGAVAGALGRLGVAARRPEPAPPRRIAERSPVCFLDRLADTLTVGGRKAVGCAQARRKGAVLVHGLALLGLEPELYARLFRADPAEVAENLGAVEGVSAEELAAAVADRLAAALELEPEEGGLDPPEEALARYATPRWAPV